MRVIKTCHSPFVTTLTKRLLPGMCRSKFPHSAASSEHGVDSYVCGSGLGTRWLSHCPPRHGHQNCKTARPDVNERSGRDHSDGRNFRRQVTVVGDYKFADYVFARRARDRQASQEVMAILEQARNTAGPGEAVLQGAVSRIEESLAKNGPDPVRTNARTNVALALADVKNGRDSAGSRLDLLADRARRGIAAAVRTFSPKFRTLFFHGLYCSVLFGPTSAP